MQVIARVEQGFQIGVLSIEERRLETEKSKVAGGDRLEHQRILENLILYILATRGEPSPSAMVIVMDGGATEAKSLGSADSILDSNLLHTDILVSTSNTFIEPGQMENHDRRLKELATPDVVYRPWCIQYPQLKPTQTYELKSGLIHLLPKFHGLAGEDPHKHLKEFHVVCSTMRPQGIPEDYIKMKAFPFSLDGAAKTGYICNQHSSTPGEI
ncbi:hypothetical protein CR513_01098, partial [Mucuna pruriens]